jgi:hypothetical protein
MKSLPANVLSAVSARTLPMTLLIEMQLTEPLYVTLANTDIDYGGKLWRGCGTAASVDPISDTTGDRQGVKFTLSSVPNDVLAIALAEPMQGKRVKVHVAIGDPETYQIIRVEQLFSGSLEQPQTQEGDRLGQVVVAAESRAETFGRPKPLRYIDSDQQRRYPGDTCMRFIVSQSQHQDVWPSAAWGRQ